VSWLRRRRKPEPPKPYGVEVLIVGTEREAQHLRREWPLLADARVIHVDNFRAAEGLRIRRVFVSPLASRRMDGHMGDVLIRNLIVAQPGRVDPHFLYLGERW
jgi:hypothetical protein